MNNGVKKMPLLKHEEVKKKTERLTEEEDLGCKTSSCGFHNVFGFEEACCMVMVITFGEESRQAQG